MAIIKFTDRGFLWEHPFVPFVDSPQSHSYIFPGDEIVFAHLLSLPADAAAVAAASISDIQLISAKVSIIAEKPGPYSEEYAPQYAATRSFELDSFQTSFTNANAKVIPWGTDGYAPNVVVKQDRNWKLPPADVRRQINWFTDHTPASSDWGYIFLFPVLFRWEYWLAKLNADNDFYDNTKPQDNLNEWWYHYFIANQWQIKSRLELQILVNGVATTIRSDLNLTPNSSLDVNDYASNADWTLKSIKTSAIGGTPSNAPALIYGYQDTEVWGYFSKVSAWGVNEQGEIKAVVWIEPFEGGGVVARTRASSVYPITPESVFIGLGSSLTDDSGFGVTDDLGNFIVADSNGNGAQVLFDGLHPEKVQVFSIIDYVKLKATYPNVNKFTLYTRLYNDTIIPAVIEVQPPSIVWGVSGTAPTVGVTPTADTNLIGIADWDTDLDTTMARLVSSINTNTNLGTLPIGTRTTFINVAGYTASWDIGAQQFTLNPPPNIGAALNGLSVAMIWIGGSMGATPAFFQAWDDGVDGSDETTTRGEELKQDVVFINSQTDRNCNPLLCGFNEPACNFNLPVFADLSDANPLKNDKTDFYISTDATVLSLAFVLQKADDDCGQNNWTDIVTISNQSYGQFNSFGFYTDENGRKYMYLFLDWRKVLIAFGVGTYRMKLQYTGYSSPPTTSDWECIDRRIFCLKKWNCNLINRTVRLETFTKGWRGTLEDNSLQIDYGAGLRGQLRLQGLLKYKSSSYVKEYNQYGEADYNSFKPIINEQIAKYTLAIRPVPGWMDYVLSTNILQADEVLVTDYNSKNRHPFIKVPVMNDGDFTPRDNNLANPLSDVEISLAYGQNSLRIKQSQ